MLLFNLKKKNLKKKEFWSKANCKIFHELLAWVAGDVSHFLNNLSASAQSGVAAINFSCLSPRLLAASALVYKALPLPKRAKRTWTTKLRWLTTSKCEHLFLKLQVKGNLFCCSQIWTVPSLTYKQNKVSRILLFRIIIFLLNPSSKISVTLHWNFMWPPPISS